YIVLNDDCFHNLRNGTSKYPCIYYYSDNDSASACWVWCTCTCCSHVRILFRYFCEHYTTCSTCCFCGSWNIGWKSNENRFCFTPTSSSRLLKSIYVCVQSSYVDY